jgi:co-chaperonin GroES (HSP10)
LKRNTDGINYPKEAMMRLQDRILDLISTHYLATVVSVSPPHVALQPIAMTKDNKKQAMVNAALVALPAISAKNSKDDDISFKVDLKKGDKVLVAVIDHDTEYYNGQDSMRVADTQPHSVNDSFVVCKVAEAGDFK